VAGRLQLQSVAHGRVVHVRREDGVDDTFWLLAQSEWGTEGARPGQALEVRLERFLAHLAWLPTACRTYRVGLRWDERTQGLARQHQLERQLLEQALRHPPAVPEDELREELAGSRSRRDLRPFQIRDLSHLLALDHGANFSVPGAGKTAVQYALYETSRLRGRVAQLLVVAPLSAFDAWVEEARQWLSPAPLVHRFDGRPVPAAAEVVLINYQRLLSSYEQVASWVMRSSTHVVLDEAHRIKRGRQGEWGNACLDLAYLAARRDVLTGTPAPQRPADLAALLDFTWAGRGHLVLPAAAYAARPPDDIGHQVAEAIRPVFTRTTKSELDLPEVDLRPLPVPMEPLHAEIYAALRDRYSGRFRLSQRDRLTFAQMGEVVMYLLEAATNPGLLVAGSSDDDAIRFRHPPLPIPADSALAELVAAYAAYENPAKFVALARLVQENADQGRKTLVWSSFVRNLQALEPVLAPHQPALIHGGVPSELTAPAAERTREQELDRFRHDPGCMVLLANPAALAEGISLHDACHDAIYVERTFNAGQYLQSLDRIHRLGLRRDDEPRVTFLLSPGTVDDVVDARVREKAERLGHMLDDPDIALMALPDEDDAGTPLGPADPEDLAALFAHLGAKDGEG
jgi:SNF2 family DNA or RNA helicase